MKTGRKIGALVSAKNNYLKDDTIEGQEIFTSSSRDLKGKS